LNHYRTGKSIRLGLGLMMRSTFTVLVQVTNRCNMKCSFCNFGLHASQPEDELTTKDYQIISRKLAKAGCLMLSIEGGEPLLRPDLTEIIKALSKYHFPVLYTNGWFIDPGIAKSLFATGVTQVGISIDFPDAARHDRNRSITGAFERACNAVDVLRRQAPHGGRQVHIMSVLMEENQNDMDALLRLSAYYKVGHFVTLISDKGCMRSKLRQLPFAPVSGKLVELRRRHKHFRSFRNYLSLMDPFLKSESMPPCQAGRFGFNIDHQGNVSPCIERIDSPVGNIIREETETIISRLRMVSDISTCQNCWTLCRYFSQMLSESGRVMDVVDLIRMRSF
jgi:MoaA/NifB/PqqE/SkfB family radical SAM enzyme